MGSGHNLSREQVGRLADRRCPYDGECLYTDVAGLQRCPECDYWCDMGNVRWAKSADRPTQDEEGRDEGDC